MTIHAVYSKNCQSTVLMAWLVKKRDT